jgi:hypothetical protein
MRMRVLRAVGCKHCEAAAARSGTRKHIPRLQGDMALEGLKSQWLVVKMGTWHAQMGRSISNSPCCPPTWPIACRRQCEPLVGRGGGFGGVELHQRAAATCGRGALASSASQPVPKKNAGHLGRPQLLRKEGALGRVAELPPLCPGGGGNFASPLKLLLNGSSRTAPGLDMLMDEPDQGHDE